jgi:hypothetical protein
VKSWFSIILLVLKRSLLLAIYALFFVVQFFSNNRAENNINYYSQNIIQKHLQTASPHHHNQTGFRLNKRFQPGIVPDFVCGVEELPVKYLRKDKIDKPDDYLLISFILASSLRGPPELSTLQA